MVDTQPVQLSPDQFAQLLGRLAGGAGNAGENASKSVKPVRPSVDIETTEGEWAIFEDQWSRFKRMAKLTAIVDIRDNLRQCCADQLNKRLFDIRGSGALDNASEIELLTWIKEIAVKGVHKEVHRTLLAKLKQKPGESINAYYGKLKAESSLCDLRVAAPATCGSVDCHCDNHGIQVSYQDDLVATQLIAGLYNSDHQAKVLSESANLPTLDDKLQRLLVLEKSDTSLSSLNESAGGIVNSNVAKGNFTKRDKFIKPRGRRYQRKPPGGQSTSDVGTRNDSNENCDVCGKKHPQCRACQGYHKCTTQCNTCKGMGHIRNCCPTSAQVSVATAPSDVHPTLEEEGVVCFCITGEEQDMMINTADKEQDLTTADDPAPWPPTPKQAVEIGDSPSALDYFEDVLETSSTMAAVSAVETVGTPSIGTVDSFSSMPMEPLLHMECVNKEFQRTKPKNAPMMKVTCKLLLEVHARYKKLLNRKRSRRTNQNTTDAYWSSDMHWWFRLAL